MSKLNSGKFLSAIEDELLAKVLAKYKNRDTLMIELLRKYGMRTNEMLALRPIDLNESAKTIRVGASKGSEEREFPLSDELFERLKVEAGRCIMEDMRIFNITDVRFRQIWYHYRPFKKKAHSLRHTCAVEMYRKTRDIKLVQAVLGHKSIANSMIYMDFAYTQDEFKKAFAV